MIGDFFKFSLDGIKKRKLRSSLTMIGIFIGIAAVVSLISLGQGLEVTITEQFQQVGSDKIFVLPGGGFGPPGAAIEKLSEHDKDVIKKVKGVEEIGASIFRFGNIKFDDQTKFLPINGMPTENGEGDIFVEAFNLDVVSGRHLKDGDGNKAVVGFRHGEENLIFDKPVKLRDSIEIEGEEFKVVGVLDKIGNPADDSNIYIPLSTAEDLFDVDDEFDFIYVVVQNGFDPNQVSENIEDEMRKDRDLDEGEENFRVQTFGDILETFNSIFGIVQAVIVGIAAISLLVGGVGIMNTMYMSVLERTKEIGVMKAIGARNSHIMQIFLFESGIYGILGGLIGILMGVGIAKGIELIAAQTLGSGLLVAHISFSLLFGALVFSFVIGALSGIAPAYRASKLHPVDALRYE